MPMLVSIPKECHNSWILLWDQHRDRSMWVIIHTANVCKLYFQHVFNSAVHPFQSILHLLENPASVSAGKGSRRWAGGASAFIASVPAVVSTRPAVVVAVYTITRGGWWSARGPGCRCPRFLWHLWGSVSLHQKLVLGLTTPAECRKSQRYDSCCRRCKCSMKRLKCEKPQWRCSEFCWLFNICL